MAAKNVTAQRLREVLDYNPQTGLFVAKISSRSRVAGAIVGGLMSSGYVQFSIDGKHMTGHRAAWLYMTGQYPRGQIDHINGNRHDNRFCNLRDVSHTANCQNKRKSIKPNRLLGAYPHQGRWMSSICAYGQRHYLGVFASEDEAHQAYVHAKRRLHESNTL